MRYKELDVVVVKPENVFILYSRVEDILNSSTTVDDLLDNVDCEPWQSDTRAGKYGNVVYIFRIIDDYIIGAFGYPGGKEDCNGWMPTLFKAEDIIGYAPDRDDYIGLFHIDGEPVYCRCSVRYGKIQQLIGVESKQIFDSIPTIYTPGDRISTVHSEILSPQQKAVIKFDLKKNKLELEEGIFL